MKIRAPGGKPGPTFEQPFEMMEACHQRVHRTLDLLERLIAHLVEQGADEQARQAARDVMRYFDQAAPQHHLDEELHVFPPLLAAADPPVVEAVRRLQSDHVAMENGWQAAREVLAALADGGADGLDVTRQAILRSFADLYSEHIRIEEALAYPRARALLDDAAQAAMGREMAGRRGAA